MPWIKITWPNDFPGNIHIDGDEHPSHEAMRACLSASVCLAQAYKKQFEVIKLYEDLQEQLSEYIKIAKEQDIK